MNRVVLSLLLLLAVPMIGIAKDANAFLDKLENAHGFNTWYDQGTISARIDLNFRGNDRLDGTMHLSPSMDRVLIKPDDGRKVGYDGETVWLSPSDAEWKSARFDIFTWPYFIAAQFKFSDPGAIVTLEEDRELFGETYKTARLTFESGVGDAPDDWYIIYMDPDTGFLKALAYIVTFNKDTEEAEKDPHIIVYDKYRQVGGTTIPMRWEFFDWSEELGAYGDFIGEATLSEVSFAPRQETPFAVPEDSTEVSR